MTGPPPAAVAQGDQLRAAVAEMVCCGARHPLAHYGCTTDPHGVDQPHLAGDGERIVAIWWDQPKEH